MKNLTFVRLAKQLWFQGGEVIGLSQGSFHIESHSTKPGSCVQTKVFFCMSCLAVWSHLMRQVIDGFSWTNKTIRLIYIRP